MQKNYNFKIMFPLMLVLFIDGVGQSIIFPLLTTTILNLDSHHQFFLKEVPLYIRNFWYGILVSVYFLAWFFSAPVLGDWSDKVGRKKALLICLILALVGFFLCIVAFYINSLLLLLFARFLGGVTSGNQAIAKASVIDSCDPAKKSIYLGLMLVPVTLGLALGPVIGVVLKDPNICSWFDIYVPFYFVSLVTVINIILLLRYFKETFSIKTAQIKWLKSITLIKEALSSSNVRLLVLTYFLTHIGWSMFYIYLPSYVTLKGYMSTFQSGIALGLAGIGMGFGLGVLPSLLRKIKPAVLIIIGYGGLLLGNILSMFAFNVIFIWIFILFTSSAFSLAVSNILSLFSNEVSEQRQGWIMGIVGATIALTAGISALILGFLANISIDAPYLFSAANILGGIIIFLYYQMGYVTNNGIRLSKDANS